MRRALVSLIASVSLAASVQAEPTNGGIAVLEFELNDLTLDPGNSEERERTASIKPMLEKALAESKHATIAVDAAAQNAADKGAGYLFDHADAAAALGRTVGAQWVVVGRVHKASFLFVYLKAHVVNVATAEQVADLVVEVKGPQKALTVRGAESLAEQIAAVVEKQSTAPTARVTGGQIRGAVLAGTENEALCVSRSRALHCGAVLERGRNDGVASRHGLAAARQDGDALCRGLLASAGRRHLDQY